MAVLCSQRAAHTDKSGEVSSHCPEGFAACVAWSTYAALPFKVHSINRLDAKGAALERAVHAIEEMVIRENPALAEAPFLLELNAVLSVNGVRHEIDLLVRINSGIFYEAMHLFECKNRADPACKSDVMLLAAKVATVGARPTDRSRMETVNP